jgi:hypothetical protein
MNRQASVFNVLMAHEQNRKIRRAIVASGNVREMDQMRRVFSTLLNSSKVASVDATFWEDADDYLKDERTQNEVKEGLGTAYLTRIINEYKERFSRKFSGPFSLISDVMKERGLVGKIHTFVDKAQKPKTPYEAKIAESLKKAGDFSSTLKMMGQLISARTPQEVGVLTGSSYDEMREYFNVGEDTTSDWALTKMEDLSQYIVSTPDTKLLVVKIGITILKISLIALLAKTALATVGLGILKVVGVVLLIVLITDSTATAQIIRKMGVSFATVGLGVIKDLGKTFKFLGRTTRDFYEKGKGWLKKIFRKAALRKIDWLLENNHNFRRSYLLTSI